MQGNTRFDFFLTKLSSLISQAVQQENPGWWLYKNDARTPAFMLEGLSRLYKQVHGDDDIKKIREDFKALEDSIGAIDYYDNLANDLEKKSSIDKKYIHYLRQNCEHKTAALNELLSERKWIGHSHNRIARCREKLDAIKWKEEAEDIELFGGYYRHVIAEINEFIDERNGQFNKLEEEVHEFRRKIRWLSIYPKSLNGSIQLSGKIEDFPELKNYFTPEIIQSPYNQMPSPEGMKSILYLLKPHFFALSWMISAIGKLKDQGLTIYGLAEALSATLHIAQDEGVSKALLLLNYGQDGISEILKSASGMVIQYRNTQSLGQLLA